MLAQSAKGFVEGSLAEWSKALASGASPKGRGFESHSCHIFYQGGGSCAKDGDAILAVRRDNKAYKRSGAVVSVLGS